jgi:hypothetical protein
MRYLLVGLLMLAFAGTSSAQFNFDMDQSKWGGGSVYSYYGIGVPNTFFSGQATGMGLQGVSIYNAYANNGANPALWGYPVFTTGLGSFYVSNFAGEDGSQSGSYTQAGIGTVQVMFPIERSRLGLNVSLRPYSTVKYSIQSQKTLPAGVLISDRPVSYATQQVGTGGLNRLEAGLGFGITENISIGVAPSVTFGLIERISEIAFDTLLFQGVEFRNRELMSGFGLRTGMFANKSHLIRKDDNLSFGLTWDLESELDVKERLYTRYTSDEVELPARSNDTSILPQKISGGLTYRPSSYLMIAVEASQQAWSKYKDVGTIENVEFTDQFSLGIGGEFSFKNRRASKFFRNLIYRGGLSHDSGYLKFEGQAIPTTLMHAGFGIPSRFTSSSIDLNFSYGVRGSGTTDFVKEKIFLTRVSFNLSEPMFLRRKIQ